MENLKIQLIFPLFFIFIFIFASISQKCLKEWVKNLFHRFSWKLPHILILIWRIEKLKTFSHIFSPSSSFLPQLVKNVLKIGWKRFSTYFLENCYCNLIVIWIIQKSNSFSKKLSSSSLFLSLLVKNGLKNQSKNFFSDFHENFCIT